MEADAEFCLEAVGYVLERAVIGRGAIGLLVVNGAKHSLS